MSSKSPGEESKEETKTSCEMDTRQSGGPEVDDSNCAKEKFFLSEIKLQNFVHFKEKQTLTFEEKGAYYFIGPNHTGKSSVFEAIRRCLSLSHNTSMSNACTDDEHSVVVCQYKNEFDNTIRSFLVRWKKSSFCVKGCFLIDKDGKVERYGVDIVMFIKDEDKMLYKEIADTPNRPEFHDETCYLDAILGWVETIPDIESKTSDVDRESYKTVDEIKSTCEKLLHEHLSNQAFVFPMRGIGPLQWSKSELIRSNKKKSNYVEASKRAEIILWYLKQKQEDKIPESDSKLERQFYTTLTNGDQCEYEYNRDTEEIEVTRYKVTYKLLKQSEGYVEAKQCSILLALQQLSLVGIDDPGTGMHVQMIERLRDLMFLKVTEKVVLITTHNRAFITPWTMANTFLFQRDDQDNCSITSGKDITIERGISTDKLGNILFANKLLFVEGPSDQLFIEALKFLLMQQTPTDHVGTYPTEEDKYVTGLSSIQCIEMSGAGKAREFRKLSLQLDKQCKVILDGDKSDKKKEKPVDFFFLDYDNIEFFFQYLLTDVMEQKINIEKKIGDSLKRCFPDSRRLVINEANRLSKVLIADEFKKVKEICRKNKTKNVQQKMRDLCEGSKLHNILEDVEQLDDFKIFLHGKENIHDRVNLIRFLLDLCKENEDFSKTKAAICLTKLRDFIEQFAKL